MALMALMTGNSNMFGIFKCSHPHEYLIVDDSSEIVSLNEYWDKITHQLFCVKCKTHLTISYAETKGKFTENDVQE